MSEVSDGKRKLARYHSVFKVCLSHTIPHLNTPLCVNQRSQQEYQETLEFSDAERNSLLLSIKEMEAQVGVCISSLLQMGPCICNG